MTREFGLVDQASRFKKRIASNDISGYRAVGHGELVVGFPIDEGVLSFQRLFPIGAVSPAYGVWRPRPSASFDISYLERYLRSPMALAWYTANLQSTVKRRRSLPPGVLQKLPIPLPPLPEQRRIAGILDAADAIRRKRRAAVQQTDALLRSTFLEMFGDPVTNPKGWPTKRLGNLGEFTGGGTPKRSVAAYFTGPHPWATPKDMRGDVLRDTQEHISDDAVANSSAKLVESPALLVVVKSKVLAKRLPVSRIVQPTAFGQDLKAFSPHVPDTIRYLHRHVSFGAQKLLRFARGANTEGLTLAHLRRFEIMQAPLANVEDFCAIDRSLEQLRTKLEAAAQEADTLFKALVQKAFRGAL